MKQLFGSGRELQASQDERQQSASISSIIAIASACFLCLLGIGIWYLYKRYRKRREEQDRSNAVRPEPLRQISSLRNRIGVITVVRDRQSQPSHGESGVYLREGQFN